MISAVDRLLGRALESVCPGGTVSPRAVLPLSCALALCIGVASSCPADTIELASGRKLTNVEITAARWDSVQYRIGNHPTSVPGSDVFQVDRESRLLQPVRQALAAGDFAKVVADAKRLAGGPAKDWEKAEIDYLLGEALLRGGDAKSAMAAFQRYLQNHKDEKDWWEPHAVYGLGMAALQLGQPKTAQTQFRQLDSFGRNWAVRAKLGEARALQRDKKYLEARRLFSEVALEARNPELVQEAKVGSADCMIGQEQYEQAIRELQRGFFEKQPAPGEPLYSRSRARATLLMGDAHAAQSGKEMLQRAEIWYLKTAALYRHYPDVYRDACTRLSALYKKLGREDRAAEWQQRLKEAGSA